LEVLTEEVVKLDNDRKSLQERVDSLTLSFRHRESIHAMTEKRLQTETMKLVKEREVLQSTLNEGASATTQIDMLRTNLSNALQGNEMLAKESREAAEKHRLEIHEKNFQLEKNELVLKSVQSECHRLRGELEDLIREREEISSALRKSIQLAKGLSQRVHDEKELREETERKLAQEQSKLHSILKAKEQVSNAMLDALHRERALQSSITKSSLSLRGGEEGSRSHSSSPQHGQHGTAAAASSLSGRWSSTDPSSPHHLAALESPSRTPVSRAPLEETRRPVQHYRHEDIGSLSSEPSTPLVHRSTIVLSDTPERSTASSTTTIPTAYPHRDSTHTRASHDFFLTQLLSPSTPAPNIPPLPIPQSTPPQSAQASHSTQPAVRESLIDDLKR
jgi:hypothetical protein